MEYSSVLDLEEGEIPDDVIGATGDQGPRAPSSNLHLVVPPCHFGS